MIPDMLNGYEQAIFNNDQLLDNMVDPSDMRFFSPDEVEYLRTHWKEFNMLEEAWKLTISYAPYNECVRWK